MFRNLRITVFIYYMLTVAALMAILYYSVSIAKVENISLLFFTLFGLSVFAGIIISKLSIDPLFEHVTNLQNLSTETLHELNLPISTIKTNMHMLKKSLTCEKDLKRTYRIDSACEMLQQRYNELDYMIKLQSADIAYEKFELSELVQERVAFLNRIYPHMEFELDLSGSQINNDKIGLSKVIDNLIDNAVKYSQNVHKISIRLQNHILYIQDFGCGIDDEELLRVFDNYYQSNKNMRGFGIGLSMVKRFCDANAVLLSFKSKPNVGTTVILKFKEN